MHAYVQSGQISSGAQHDAQRFAAFVDIHSGFRAGHHGLLWCLESCCPPVQSRIVLRVANDYVEYLAAAGPTSLGVEAGGWYFNNVLAFSKRLRNTCRAE